MQLEKKDLFGAFVFTFNIMKINVLRGAFGVVMLTNTGFGDGGIWDAKERDSLGSDTLVWFFFS